MARLKIEEGYLAIGNSAVEGNLSISDTLYIGSNNFEFNTNSVSIGTAVLSTIDTYASGTYHFAKYLVTAKNDAGTKFHSQEILVVNHGTNTFITTYGEVWNDHALGTLDANSASGLVSLTFLPVANAVPMTVSSYRTIQA